MEDDQIRAPTVHVPPSPRSQRFFWDMLYTPLGILCRSKNMRGPRSPLCPGRRNIFFHIRYNSSWQMENQQLDCCFCNASSLHIACFPSHTRETVMRSECHKASRRISLLQPIQSRFKKVASLASFISSSGKPTVLTMSRWTDFVELRKAYLWSSPPSKFLAPRTLIVDTSNSVFGRSLLEELISYLLRRSCVSSFLFVPVTSCHHGAATSDFRYGEVAQAELCQPRDYRSRSLDHKLCNAVSLIGSYRHQDIHQSLDI